MASTKEYLDYVLEQLSGLEGVDYRAMMGAYVLYYRGKVVGGIYDDRLLVKDVPAARELLPHGATELPYEGGKPMLAADVDDREGLAALMEALYDALPAPKKRR